MGLRLSAAWGCAWGVPRGVHGGGGGEAHHGLLASPPPRPSPGGYWCLGCKRDAWPHHRLLGSRCKGGGGRLAWGCVGAQHGAPHERSMGLRMGAAWGCARARYGAAQERCVGLRMGCAKGRAWGGGGLTTGYWRLPRRGPHQEDIGAWAASAMRGLTTGCWPRAVRGQGGGWHGAA